MKKRIIICLVICTSFIFSQEKVEKHVSPHFSLHGGINFTDVKNLWGAFLFEGKTPVSKNLLIKLSFGYTNLIKSRNYTVNSFTERKIENILAYEAVSYEISKIEYQIIPISVGLQYNINSSLFHPYTFMELGYNLIDPKSYKEKYQVLFEYDKYGELPLEHRNVDVLPNGSYKVAIGVGFNYLLTTKLGLDVRFLTQIDSELIESNQLLVGLSF